MRALLVALFLLFCAPASAATYNVLNYGAVPNDGIDDSAAVQAAINQLQPGAYNNDAVYIPCGTYNFSSTVVFGNNGYRLIGESSSCVKITGANLSLFRVSTSTGTMHNVFSGVACIFDSIQPGNSCLQFVGSAPAASITHSQHSDIRCFKAHVCIYNLRSVNVSGEAQFDWNLFTDIQVSHSNYSFYTENGSGTGNVYTNMNLAGYLAGMVWAGNNGANVGDITIANIQFGGGGIAINLSPAASYRERVTITNAQCDAGIATCVAAQNYKFLSLIGVVLGGGVGNYLPGVVGLYCGSYVC